MILCNGWSLPSVDSATLAFCLYWCNELFVKASVLCRANSAMHDANVCGFLHQRFILDDFFSIEFNLITCHSHNSFDAQVIVYFISNFVCLLDCFFHLFMPFVYFTIYSICIFHLFISLFIPFVYSTCLFHYLFLFFPLFFPFLYSICLFHYLFNLFFSFVYSICLFHYLFHLFISLFIPFVFFIMYFNVHFLISLI